MITTADLQQAASKLGIEVAALQALSAKESKGAPYLKDGRLRILYERHWFHKLTKGKFTGKVGVQISYPKATPAGQYGTYTDQWLKLEQAMKLDRHAALKSASWGRYQILGVNYNYCGYLAVTEMVNDFQEREISQLTALCVLLTNKGWLNYLIALDWENFALHYNGPDYKKNNYVKEISSLYDFYKRQGV